MMLNGKLGSRVNSVAAMMEVSLDELTVLYLNAGLKWKIMSQSVLNITPIMERFNDNSILRKDMYDLYFPQLFLDIPA